MAKRKKRLQLVTNLEGDAVFEFMHERGRFEIEIPEGSDTKEAADVFRKIAKYLDSDFEGVNGALGLTISSQIKG